MKYVLILSCLFAGKQVHSQTLMDLKKNVQQNMQRTSASFTQDEAVRALRDALQKGAVWAAEKVHQADGYFKNPKIKIPLPPDAQQAESRMRSMGLGNTVDEAVLNLNRAAEAAGESAKEVFVQAIKNLTAEDAISIIKGQPTAGTQYLKDQSGSQLYQRFKPIIEQALQQVGATRHYTALAEQYNRIPGVAKINPNLADFTTQKAIEGLFLLIGEEEQNIRANPAARTTELLKKVFQ